ncbi:transglutaminase family protein [Actinotalea sp. M2MS4P-6]|uniref:transglutaminase family protein n=1 Tax=Actinotalea sp. M2MS4P-6 TaxID=2983762 RepID=UPI0021E3C76B|nr:transglutaminase family protein [Actinotalea sp. M2MS4P-6]MCV2393620.1 transglutaminase family protein [Actinotalea sp. M2MS4P-6]
MRRTYELVHHTRYTYDQPVTTSYGRAVLLPRDLPEQTRHTASVVVAPEPADTAEQLDYFGNTTSYFAITRPHAELEVTARSRVTVDRPELDISALPRATWSDVARMARPGGTVEADRGEGVDSTDGIGLVQLREALLPSRHVAPSAEVREWAAPSFVPGRPVVEVLVDLAHRIRTEMAYRPGSTTVSTTQVELLDLRAGVCQDFAHLMIAALRTYGVPARYASGYIETQPPPGRPKLRGADASHAWASAWVPGAGWLEVDPTNDCFVDSRYVVLGWGRDYGDVPPLRGVIFTDGSQSRLEVSVDLHPVDSPDAEPGV